jgi:N-acetylglutamate synthase-like GNAT family acetyltransferase
MDTFANFGLGLIGQMEELRMTNIPITVINLKKFPLQALFARLNVCIGRDCCRDKEVHNMVEIRPFLQDDWAVLFDLANQAVPFAQQGNITWLNNRKAFDDTRRIRRHFIATKNGLPVGYSCIEQQSEDPAWLRIYVVCSPEYLNEAVGMRLYESVIQAAKELGAEHLWAQEYQADRSIGRFFTERGFDEVRRFAPPNELPMVVYQRDWVK